MTVICFFIMIFISRSLLVNYFLIGTVGLFSSFRLNVGFIYGQEIIPRKHANIIGSFYNTLDSCTMMMVSVYFKYFSKEWIYIECILFGISLVALIISLYLPESPKYLVAKGHY
jgi:hypothetical protein